MCVRYPHVCQMNMPGTSTNICKIYMLPTCEIFTYMSDIYATYMCKIPACVSDEYATYIYRYIQDIHATHM